MLSHDLFEGLYARTALVSDIEVVDDYPSSVLAHARRQHRWVRGDWQILLWLFPFVPTRTGFARNRLPLISRWKILDNLRRSLVAPGDRAAPAARLDVAAGQSGGLDARRARRRWRSPPSCALLEAVGRPAPVAAVARVPARRWSKTSKTALARASLQLTFLALPRLPR